eukprot:5847097-Amphidinium_carterae.1
MEALLLVWFSHLLLEAVTEAGIVKPLVGLLKHGVSETRAEAAATIDVLIGFPSNKQKDGEDADPRMQLVHV